MSDDYLPDPSPTWSWRMRWVIFRSLAFVIWREFRYGGLRYAMRRSTMRLALRGRSAMSEHYSEQLRKLAEVGASLCCYLPGAHDPEAWPNSRCDCKFLPPIPHGPIADIHLSSEQTGCCEVRTAWRTLDALRRLSQR